MECPRPPGGYELKRQSVHEEIRQVGGGDDPLASEEAQQQRGQDAGQEATSTRPGKRRSDGKSMENPLEIREKPRKEKTRETDKNQATWFNLREITMF